jgi:hypothetical protein
MSRSTKAVPLIALSALIIVVPSVWANWVRDGVVPSKYSVRLAILAVSGSYEADPRISKTESRYEEGCVWGARLFLYELGVPRGLTPALERHFFGVALFPAQA